MTDIIERATSALRLSTDIPPGCARYYISELIANVVSARTEVLRLTAMIDAINVAHAQQILQIVRTSW
jgi:hypothetical protein